MFQDPIAGIGRNGVALFSFMATMLGIDLVLVVAFRISDGWIYAVIAACGFSAIALWLYWYWRFPYSFGRSPPRYRPTSFGQHGRIWQNLVWFMGAGSFLPVVATFREIGVSQVLGSMLLGFWLYFALYSHIWNQQNQRERDIRADKLFRDLRDGTKHDVAAYLRPFDTTGTMQTVREAKDGRPSRQLPDLEAIIAEAVEPTRPLIGLGQPGEQLGVGRAESGEKDWWEKFKLLADSATTLFVLPNRGDGTKKEINWILEKGLLAKCIFIMPGGWSERWDSADKEGHTVRLEYPDYRNTGCLFTLKSKGKNSGRLDGAIELNSLLDNPRELARSINALSSRDASATLPPGQNRDAVEPAGEGSKRFFLLYRKFVYLVNFGVLATVFYFWLQ